ncbi:thiol reductant ABC exporter subunit CydD [Naumannella halotolerans]|uniref:ATP-binding cassette subfamily C protein CydCD n=1 Tax=Naumannella halotolerans TaxID=993414 RepID=A0A4R7J3J2_9ACTN|nr:thiol reductant ABC exporter subunit CydD [Naumannella halotolerans]TDT30967.1 ATP-binding cassette subfamily C protein CydCD [Naumannella halotolerans]
MAGPVDPRLLRRSRPTRSYIGALVGLGVAQSLVTIGQAWLLAVGISGMVAGGPWQLFGWQLLGVAGGFAVRALIAAGQQWAGHRASAAVKSQLRHDLLAARLQRPFDADTNGGKLITVVTEGVEALDGWFSGYLPQLVLAVVVPLTLLVAIGWADPISMGIMIVTLPLIPIFMILIGLVTKARMDARWRSDSRLAHHFADLLSGLTTLQIFGRARGQLTGLQRVEQQHRRATMQVLRIALISALVLEVLATLSVALVAVSIGLRVVEVEMSLLFGLFVLVLAPEAYLPLRQVGARYHDAADGMAAAEDAFALIDADADAPSGREKVDLATSTIELDRASLSPAPGVRPVISGLSMIIGPGSVVGIAGPSGVGKSTLVRTLLGQAPPVSGRLLIGGVEITEVDRDDLWRQIAWVEQNPGLLPGTIAENVAVGCPGAPAGRVRAALRRASAGFGDAATGGSVATGLHPDRMIADDGSGLSAGEVRRIALARALLKIDCGGAKLLLLDEPTAGLDATTEADVVAELAALGVTVAMVSHRSAALQVTDEVIELHGAEVPAGADPASDSGSAPVIAATSTAKVSDAVPVGKTDATGAGDALGTAAAAGGHPRDRAPQDRAEETPGEQTSLTRLADRMWLNGGWQRRLLWVGTTLLGTAAAGSAVALLGVSGWLLARASEHPPVLFLMVAVVGVRFFGLGRGVFRYAERLAGHHLGLRDQSELRIRTYDALSAAPAAGRRQGELVDRVVADVATSADRILRFRLPLAVAAAVSVAVVVFLAWSAPLVALVFALYAVVAGWWVPRLAVRLSRRQDSTIGALRGDLAEVAWRIHRNAPMLATHAAAGRELQLLDAADAQLVAAERRAATARAFSSLGQLLCLAIAWPLLVITAGMAAQSGQWGSIMIAAVALLPLGMHEVFLPLTETRQAGIRSGAAFQRVSQVISEANAQPPVSPVPALDRVGVETSGLVLQRGSLPPVDLDLRSGDRVVLVGPSGIGKSTLLATLLGQLPPASGSVRVGGKISCLSQDAHIFDTTVEENLRIGDPRAGADRLRQTLVEAGAPGLELDRRVGEHGSRISGGESRRLAFARVLAACPEVLLLDEPTEHLDVPTATALLRDVDASLPRAAMLVVSHQPDLILATWGASARVIDVTEPDWQLQWQASGFPSTKESHDQEGTR